MKYLEEKPRAPTEEEFRITARGGYDVSKEALRAKTPRRSLKDVASASQEGSRLGRSQQKSTEAVNGRGAAA
jgi:hypothetical protein